MTFYLPRLLTVPDNKMLHSGIGGLLIGIGGVFELAYADADATSTTRPLLPRPHRPLPPLHPLCFKAPLPRARHGCLVSVREPSPRLGREDFQGHVGYPSLFLGRYRPKLQIRSPYGTITSQGGGTSQVMISWTTSRPLSTQCRIIATKRSFSGDHTINLVPLHSLYLFTHFIRGMHVNI